MNTRTADRALIAVAVLAFLASAAATVAWSRSMSSMPGMAMPGGWTMSMAWMRMSGQSWEDVAATFVGMWALMMVAMMLPSLVPMLSGYRQRVGARNGLAAMAAVGYFIAWTTLGAVVFPLGAALAELAMRVPPVARAAPVMAGVVVLGAGALQVSAWKIRQLRTCRRTAMRCATDSAVCALRDGLHMGVRCIRCCAGLTAVLLVTGVMDLIVMALVTAAISAERLLPGGERVARGVGAVTLAAGVLVVATRVAAG